MQQNKLNNMLLKEITIENFKTFIKPQKLKIAPITLLYGENSSGKTSVLKTIDIIMNMFGYGYKKPLTDTSKYHSFFSDIKKNISPERINILSSLGNNKPIIIKFKFDIQFSKNESNSMIFDKNELIEKIFFNEYTIYPKNLKDTMSYEFKNIFKKESNLATELEIGLHIKHFENSKNFENSSKVDKIEVNYKNKLLFSYTRKNKVYDYIKDKNITGFIDPKDRKSHLKEYLDDQDFFSSPFGYADYKLNLSENSLIIDKSFRCYEEILKENKKNFHKIEKIISYYKNYLSNEYLYSLKNDFEETELKKLKIFEVVAKIILGDENFNIEDLKEKNEYDIERINKFLNNKNLISERGKSLIMFSNLISNIRNEDIYNLELIFKRKVNKKKFSNIIINSFKNHSLRFIRNKYGLETFPRSLIDENLKNFSIYDNDFGSKNGIVLPGVPTFLDTIFYINHYIKNSLNNICLKKNRMIGGKQSQVSQINYTCKRPSSVIIDCLFSIFQISKSIQRTSPGSTEETFSIFTLNEIKKFENLSIINQFPDSNLNLVDKEKNRDLLLQAINKFKDEKLNNKYDKEKVLMVEHDNEKNEDFFENDPTQYYLNKKNIEDLGEAGEFFNSIIINNKKERNKLNKYLKKFFDIEIIIVDLKYFKNFSKRDQIMIKRLITDTSFKATKINDKFVMIKDLKFKKNFNIHGIEVGKGPSNIFPFLLQILNDKPNLTFAIQELENNWHPKYHSKLILLLVEIIKSSTNKSYILETHSELFVLQIQRLVQKGILKPSDISINYISRSPNGNSDIINLPINTNGAFEKKWPGGFFTERMKILTS